MLDKHSRLAHKRLRMANLKSLKLHQLIGTSTVWTDELWDEALTYLLDRVGTLDVLTMVDVLPESALPHSPYKVDYLRVFRRYPPTLLLGAFDYLRAVKESRHGLATTNGMAR